MTLARLTIAAVAAGQLLATNPVAAGEWKTTTTPAAASRTAMATPHAAPRVPVVNPEMVSARLHWQKVIQEKEAILEGLFGEERELPKDDTEREMVGSEIDYLLGEIKVIKTVLAKGQHKTPAALEVAIADAMTLRDEVLAKESGSHMAKK
ncbi:MAG: hypothetical protein WAZ18_05710 [Alphaproteobacteria bacterium]